MLHIFACKHFSLIGNLTRWKDVRAVPVQPERPRHPRIADAGLDGPHGIAALRASLNQDLHLTRGHLAEHVHDKCLLSLYFSSLDKRLAFHRETTVSLSR